MLSGKLAVDPKIGLLSKERDCMEGCRGHGGRGLEKREKETQPAPS